MMTMLSLGASATMKSFAEEIFSGGKLGIVFSWDEPAIANCDLSGMGDIELIRRLLSPTVHTAEALRYLNKADISSCSEGLYETNLARSSSNESTAFHDSDSKLNASRFIREISENSGKPISGP